MTERGNHKRKRWTAKRERHDTVWKTTGMMCDYERVPRQKRRLGWYWSHAYPCWCSSTTSSKETNITPASQHKQKAKQTWEYSSVWLKPRYTIKECFRSIVENCNIILATNIQMKQERSQQTAIMAYNAKLTPYQTSYSCIVTHSINKQHAHRKGLHRN
jgi:hypothetical protein